MLRDFRIAWRLLLRHPLNTAVELLGLAFGFAVCFLLIGFVHYSFSYDDDVPQREQVYLIKHRLNFIPQPQWMEYTPFALREVALQSGLPLQASVWWPSKAMLNQNGMLREIDITAVDPSFEQIAGLQALRGDLHQALVLPDGLALTQQAAKQLFGTGEALGRTLVVNQQTLQVRAVLPDRPSNSTLQFGVLVGIGSTLWTEQERQQVLSNWMGIAGRIYVKTSASPQTLQNTLQDVIDKAPWASLATPEMKAALSGRKMVDVALGPLADAYFDLTVANTMGVGQRGDMRMVLALGAAGLLILLLAVVNYINLSTIRALRRQREIAVRRVMGAGTRQLLAQFMSEAMLLSLSAAALGVLLAWLLLPLTSELLQRRLDNVFTPLSVTGCLAFGALVGALAGIYPGWLARGVDMRATLSQRSGETPGGAWLRRALTAVQFSAAIGMGSVALAILWQTQFASAAPPGFDPAPLLAVEVQTLIDPSRADALHDAVAQLPGVAGVTWSRKIPGRDDHTGTRGSTTVQRNDGSSVALAVQMVGRDFFKVYGVQALAGRIFDVREHQAAEGEQSVMLNQAAVKALGWTSAQQALGQRINGSQLRVVGVAPDLRWETLRDPVRPMMYQLLNDSGLMTVRLDGARARAEVEAAIAAIWQRYYPAQPVAIQPLASYYAQAYADDMRLARLLACATAMVLVLASFGIYVLAAHSVQRRAREIVLRKLHGAGRAAIGLLVGREFVLLAGVAALIALPPAWLAIARYLAPFAERSPLGVWAPLAALALALLVVIAASARHTWSAMRIAPVRALRE
ncbi:MULTISPECIES: ABC transporter permease [unclassified Duganella]|uniref:ABC transporter permease n=1 Tax=unclassified Duganella TaxID=2636909 RepID=UPI000888ABC5|nr:MULTISPECIES: ABC transporter permease [unclassified Duganella]SDG92104.1 FtsX-like permease family protein [Duganella sp. OV458]SDJ50300.1 ABC-type transport system, involved in lipoprotein release, permease component [Duganella sp. OV510]